LLTHTSEKKWRKSSRLRTTALLKYRTVNVQFVVRLRQEKRLVLADWLFLSRLILRNKMTNAKKILITTESHELFIVRRTAPTSPRYFCPVCSTQTCGVTLDDAGAYANLSSLELIKRIGADLHAVETDSGALLICQKSLEMFCNGEK
jgi:hypothetical protein